MGINGSPSLSQVQSEFGGSNHKYQFFINESIISHS